MARIDRRLVLVLVLASFSTYSYFYQGGDWNQNSRLDLALALARDRTVVISRYVGNTGDWSRVGEQFYSNKAPGPSFVACPVFMLAGWIEQQANWRLSEFWRGSLYLWLGSVVSVAAISALGVGALYLLLQQLCPGQRRWNLIVAVFYAIATPAFPFSTAWYGHQPAGSLLLIAFYLLVLGQQSSSNTTAMGLVSLAGLSAGAAVTCDYPAVLIVLLFSGYGWYRYRWRGSVCWVWLAAASLPILALGVYNQSVTGVFYESAYRYENPAFAPQRFGKPELWKLGALLFGPDRGLFFSSPVLAVGLAAGLWPAWRRRPAETLIILAVFLCLVGFNTTLAAWDGGATFTARYLIGSVPFVVLLLAWTPVRALTVPVRALTVLVGSFSAAMMLIATSVSISSPEWARPYTRYYFPNFIEGRISLNPQHALELHADSTIPLGSPGRDRAWCSFNWGELIGLSGLMSLAPLVGLWMLAGGCFYRWLRHPAAADRQRPNGPSSTTW